MADVFISYAKADRPLALKLAAMLEAEGWKVWWDTGLIPGDDFRNEIMSQLGRARAVIVIWTDASIKSDWVRSEAGRAQADRKLIPVKLPNLSYKDLPPPFDVLHTEDIGQEDKIKAAVVAQLAKPAVEPTAIALLTKGFRYELLTWVGIVGGALTLFGNLDAVLKLADWVRVLVDHWKEWTHAFWVWVFGWLGIHLPPEWTPVVSFLLFAALLTIGQAMKFGWATEAQTKAYKYDRKSYHLASWRTIACLGASLSVVNLWSGSPENFFPMVALPMYILGHMFGRALPSEVNLGSVFWLPVLILAMMSPVAILVVTFAKVRLYAALVTVLMVIFWTIIAFYQILGFEAVENERAIFVASAMMPVLLLILLSVAPAKAISRRLIFLALGLLLLIALNELSKLGLDVTAPKLQG